MQQSGNGSTRHDRKVTLVTQMLDLNKKVQDASLEQEKNRFLLFFFVEVFSRGKQSKCYPQSGGSTPYFQNERVPPPPNRFFKSMTPLPQSKPQEGVLPPIFPAQNSVLRVDLLSEPPFCRPRSREGGTTFVRKMVVPANWEIVIHNNPYI